MLSQSVALHRAAFGQLVRNVFMAVALIAAAASLSVQGAMAASAPPANTPDAWAGMGWGLGVSTDFHLGSKEVTGAELVNGNTILRVTDTTQDVGVGFILEAHYFVTDRLIGPLTGLGPPGSCSTSSSGTPALTYGCTEVASGPFVAIEVGGGTSATTDAGPITGYGLGYMVGFHHAGASNTSSWNFGAGLRIDPHTQVLGDGFAPNMPPPAGETSVRWQYQTRYGVMLLSSFSF